MQASPDQQKIVWQFLRAISYMDRPTFVADKDGKICPLKAAQCEGRRTVFLELELQTKLAKLPRMPEEPKPKRNERRKPTDIQL